LNDLEAINYLKLLNEKKIFDLDSTSKYFIHKDIKTFWIPVLVDMCHIERSIAEIWAGRKEDMLTSAMLRHYKISGINRQLSAYLAHFNKMSYEEIADIY